MNDTAINAATNETLVGDLMSYFRYNEETREYELNARVNPRVEHEAWSVCPSHVRDRFANPNGTLTVGDLVWLLNEAAMRGRRAELALRDRTSAAEQAMEIIGQRLIEEADKRDWCAEFDKIIDEVNESLPAMFQLPRRKREYEVEWQQTVTVVVSRSMTVTASDEEEAVEIARNESDNIMESDVIEAVRYRGWDEDWDGDSDWCATEV